MRAHGIKDFPDPSAHGLSLNAGPGSDLNLNDPQFQAAQKACAKYESAGLTPVEKARDTAKPLRYAECMRPHGVTDFPDPTTTIGGGVGCKVKLDQIDESSPTYQAASRACHHLTPRGSD